MRALFVFLLISASGLATAQTEIPPLTPDRIREAIAQAEAPKYQIDMVEWPFTPVIFDTPFQRVAEAAIEAKRAYRPFAITSVTAKMTAPEVNVVALPALKPPVLPAGYSDVVAIILMPIGSDDRGRAILPISQEKFRAPEGGNGLMATFPLLAMRVGNELRVVYREKVCAGATPKAPAAAKIIANWKLSTECRYPVRLDKVR